MTKKIFLILIVLALCVNKAFSQISVNSTTAYLQVTTEPNINSVILINGISSNTSITTSVSGNVEWRLYDGSLYSNQTTIYPENAKGYVLYQNNAPIFWLWVIDYSLYPVSFNGFSADGSAASACQTLILNCNVNAPDLVYHDKNNVRQILKRTFKLAYTDYTFDEEKWVDSEVAVNHEFPFTTISVNAPKKDVEFVLSGDNYSSLLNLTPDSVTLSYSAVGVETHIRGKVEKRGGEIEAEDNRDNSSGDKSLSGSGPLVVFLESRANTPTASSFEWFIYNSENPNAYNRYSEENVRYTFKQSGSYYAKLIAKSTAGCQVIDSVLIVVLESKLQVPNAFSPNGDGVNDEFRVAFSSLYSFKMVVFNRLGGIVFESSNPLKGWNGTFRGKNAAAGTYYYVIEATGTDIHTSGKNKGKRVQYKAKGHINLFR